MRILHVVLTPRYSGAEMLVRDLSLVHAAQGHPTAVCALNPAEASFVPEVDKLRRSNVDWILPRRPLGRLGRLHFLRFVATAQFAPDVVVAHSVIPSAYARLALLGKRRRRRPAVVSVLHAGANDYARGRLLYLERMISKRADAIVAVTPSGLDQYSHRIGAHPRTRAIPNGVPVAGLVDAATRRGEHRQALGVAEDASVVLQVGRLAPVKQQHLTLAAMIPLLHRDERLQLWFAGIEEAGAYAQSLRLACRQAGVEQAVRFLGPRADVPELLAAGDVFVMPSAAEAHSIALLEALASGTPVVASDIPPFRFAARHGGVSLVDPADLAQFRDAVALHLRRPARYGRDVSAFSIERTGEAYLSLFEEIVNGPGSPARAG